MSECSRVLLRAYSSCWCCKGNRVFLVVYTDLKSKILLLPPRPLSQFNLRLNCDMPSSCPAALRHVPCRLRPGAGECGLRARIAWYMYIVSGYAATLRVGTASGLHECNACRKLVAGINMMLHSMLSHTCPCATCRWSSQTDILFVDFRLPPNTSIPHEVDDVRPLLPRTSSTPGALVLAQVPKVVDQRGRAFRSGLRLRSALCHVKPGDATLKEKCMAKYKCGRVYTIYISTSYNPIPCSDWANGEQGLVQRPQQPLDLAALYRTSSTRSAATCPRRHHRSEKEGREHSEDGGACW